MLMLLISSTYKWVMYFIFLRLDGTCVQSKFEANRLIRRCFFKYFWECHKAIVDETVNRWFDEALLSLVVYKLLHQSVHWCDHILCKQIPCTLDANPYRDIIVGHVRCTLGLKYHYQMFWLIIFTFSFHLFRLPFLP